MLIRPVLIPALELTSKSMELSTTGTLAPLILDFLEWIAAGPRPYTEVMGAWRTSCPRFTVWEDVLDAGFVIRKCDPNREMLVDLTPRGRSFLEGSGRPTQPRA